MPPRQPEQTNQTILLDIYERLGVVETQNKEILREQESAADGRGRLYERIETIHDRMAGFDQVAVKVGEMAPSVEDYKALRQNINGGVIVLAGIGAALFTAIGFLAKDMWAMWIKPWLARP